MHDYFAFEISDMNYDVKGERFLVLGNVYCAGAAALFLSRKKWANI